MDSEDCELKYYHACIKYMSPTYSYMGVHSTTRIREKDEETIKSTVFSIDHSPTQIEIIKNVVSCYYDEGYFGAEIISYSPITKEDYDAYNS